MAEEFSFIAAARSDYMFVLTVNSLAHIKHLNTALNFDGTPPGILCGISAIEPAFTDRGIRKLDTMQLCGVCVVKAVLAEIGEVNDI